MHMDVGQHAIASKCFQISRKSYMVVTSGSLINDSFNRHISVCLQNDYIPDLYHHMFLGYDVFVTHF